MCSCPAGCKARLSLQPRGAPGHPDWTQPSAGAHTPFLTLCAAYFRFEIADRPARPLHPVRTVCHMLSIYCLEHSLPHLPGLACHSSSVSSSSDILPCPPPTRSLILLIPPNNYFVPSLLSNDCQRFYFMTIPVKNQAFNTLDFCRGATRTLLAVLFAHIFHRAGKEPDILFSVHLQQSQLCALVQNDTLIKIKKKIKTQLRELRQKIHERKIKDSDQKVSMPFRYLVSNYPMFSGSNQHSPQFLKRCWALAFPSLIKIKVCST